MTGRPGGKNAMRRRDFIRHSVLLTASPLLLSALMGRAGAAGLLAGPSAKASINVRDKGACGDGKTDDTRAFQAAIDALPSAGGTVVVPPGNYMIDASRSVNLRSNMRLQMDSQAQLTAIPNKLTHYSVVKVFNADNSSIVGGRIVGERDGHDGSTGEWGYGLNIRASNNVKITDLHISDCWGDGIWIGATGRGIGVELATAVTLDRVVSTNNRRQGLSIGPVRGVTVANSTFSNSNGTAPEAGIDLEPMGQGPARDITIESCTITGNHGTGLEMHDHVSGVAIRQCTVTGNRGYGVLGVGAGDVVIADNVVSDNGLVGVVIGKRTHGVQISGNTLTSNSTRYVHRALKSIETLTSSDAADKHPVNLKVFPSATDVRTSNNKFSS